MINYYYYYSLIILDDLHVHSHSHLLIQPCTYFKRNIHQTKHFKSISSFIVTLNFKAAVTKNLEYSKRIDEYHLIENSITVFVI